MTRHQSKGHKPWWIHYVLVFCWMTQASCGSTRSEKAGDFDVGSPSDRTINVPSADTPFDRVVLDQGYPDTDRMDRQDAGAAMVQDVGMVQDMGIVQDVGYEVKGVKADVRGTMADAGDSSDVPLLRPSLPRFILGADISITLEDEYWGATYTDAGKEKSIEQLLKDHGFNFIRINTFVNPGAPGGYAVGKPQPFRDLAHTLTLAKRVKKIGLGLLLDLHYSDNWTDPSHQTIPQAWSGLNLAALEAKVHEYTKDVLSSLKNAGALPDIVQVGNEITSGMLWESGRAVDSNFRDFARLLKAGIQAVREVDPFIQIMLHIEKCHDIRASEWWLDGVLGQGVVFDILGQSCYATAPNGVVGYQGSPRDWQATFSALATRYPQLKFIIAEYSAEERAANDTMHRLPDGRGLGTFNWDPTRAYDTHPNHPLFSTLGAWNHFVAIPEQMAVYDQMATDYGLR